MIPLIPIIIFLALQATAGVAYEKKLYKQEHKDDKNFSYPITR